MLKRNKRFQNNRLLLLDPYGFEMPFPRKLNNYPAHLREVFQYILNSISSNDLVALQEGETADENLINVYFKILEKFNQVLLSRNDYIKKQAALDGG